MWPGRAEICGVNTSSTQTSLCAHADICGQGRALAVASRMGVPRSIGQTTANPLCAHAEWSEKNWTFSKEDVQDAENGIGLDKTQSAPSKQRPVHRALLAECLA